MNIPPIDNSGQTEPSPKSRQRCEPGKLESELLAMSSLRLAEAAGNGDIMPARMKQGGIITSILYRGRKIRITNLCRFDADFRSRIEDALNTDEAKKSQEYDIYHELAKMSVSELEAAVAMRALAPERILHDQSLSSVRFKGKKIRVSRVMMIDEGFDSRLIQALK